MSDVSKLFDERSYKYDAIYSDLRPDKLLHQEKQIRASLAEGVVLERLDPSRKSVIVDVGCGTGRLLLRLQRSGANAEFIGIDISPEMIDMAKAKVDSQQSESIRFLSGEMTDLLNKKADVLLSLGVIGYQQDQAAFLKDLSAAVSDTGYLIFSTANGDSLLRPVRQTLSKLHGVLKRERKSNGIKFSSMKDADVESALAESGFGVQKRVYITFGLGLIASAFECALDRLLYKMLSNRAIGRYLSLTVVYVCVRNRGGKYAK